MQLVTTRKQNLSSLDKVLLGLILYEKTLSVLLKEKIKIKTNNDRKT